MELKIEDNNKEKEHLSDNDEDDGNADEQVSDIDDDVYFGFAEPLSDNDEDVDDHADHLSDNDEDVDGHADPLLDNDENVDGHADNDEDVDADIESGDECLSNESLMDVDEGRNISGNMAWAKAMQDVLGKTPQVENFILSKAKKDSDIKKEKVKDIELVDSSGKVIESNFKVKREKSYKEIRKAQLENQKKKAEWEAMCRVKPDIIKKERERELIKIATRGVVHLFNAVGEHQKTVKNKKKDARKSEKINVVKGTFMDILKQHSKQDKKTEVDPAVEKAKKEETWSILKDDFMMGAEMKDWDRDSDNET